MWNTDIGEVERASARSDVERSVPPIRFAPGICDSTRAPRDVECLKSTTIQIADLLEQRPVADAARDSGNASCHARYCSC